MDHEEKSARAIAAVAVALQKELSALIKGIGFTDCEAESLEITPGHVETAKCLRNDAFCRETIESVMQEYGGFTPCDDEDSHEFHKLVPEFLAIAKST